MNESKTLYVLIRNATVINGAGIPPFTADIGLIASRRVQIVERTPRSADGRDDRRHRRSPNARRAPDDRRDREDCRAAVRREVERRADRRSAGVAAPRPMRPSASVSPRGSRCSRPARSQESIRWSWSSNRRRRSVRAAFRASIDDLPIEDGHLDAHRRKVRDGRLEDVVRQDDDVGEHAWGDGAFALLVERCPRRARCIPVDRALQRQPRAVLCIRVSGRRRGPRSIRGVD